MFPTLLSFKSLDPDHFAILLIPEKSSFLFIHTYLSAMPRPEVDIIANGLVPRLATGKKTTRLKCRLAKYSVVSVVADLFFMVMTVIQFAKIARTISPATGCPDLYDTTPCCGCCGKKPAPPNIGKIPIALPPVLFSFDLTVGPQ
jgi:hypothetical protein